MKKMKMPPVVNVIVPSAEEWSELGRLQGVIECKRCGTTIEKPTYNQLYCSKKCANNYGEVDVVCRYCGITFKSGGRVGQKNRYCCEEHKKAAYKEKSGFIGITKKKCPICNRTFEGSSKRIYCSDLCSYTANNRRHRDKLPPIIKKKGRCKKCNSVFEKKNSRQIYCSVDCQMSDRNRKKTKKRCRHCKRWFFGTPRQVYDSKECYTVHNNILEKAKKPVYKRKCRECGEKFTTTNKTKLTCSKECNNSYQGKRRKRMKNGKRVYV